MKGMSQHDYEVMLLHVTPNGSSKRFFRRRPTGTIQPAGRTAGEPQDYVATLTNCHLSAVHVSLSRYFLVTAYFLMVCAQKCSRASAAPARLNLRRPSLTREKLLSRPLLREVHIQKIQRILMRNFGRLNPLA